MIIDPFHFNFLLEEVEDAYKQKVDLRIPNNTVKAKRSATATITLMEVMEAI